MTRSLGLRPIEFFGSMPLLSIVVIVAWEWTPFAVLILLPALQSLIRIRKKRRGWMAPARWRFSGILNCRICCAPWR